jgi:hypothetical protein
MPIHVGVFSVVVYFLILLFLRALSELRSHLFCLLNIFLVDYDELSDDIPAYILLYINEKAIKEYLLVSLFFIIHVYIFLGMDFVLVEDMVGSLIVEALMLIVLYGGSFLRRGVVALSDELVLLIKLVETHVLVVPFLRLVLLCLLVFPSIYGYFILLTHWIIGSILRINIYLYLTSKSNAYYMQLKSSHLNQYL